MDFSIEELIDLEFTLAVRIGQLSAAGSQFMTQAAADEVERLKALRQRFRDQVVHRA